MKRRSTPVLVLSIGLSLAAEAIAFTDYRMRKEDMSGRILVRCAG